MKNVLMMIAALVTVLGVERASADEFRPEGGWKKARTVSCVLGENGVPTTAVELKVGKANAKSGAVKITGTITGFASKSVTLKTVGAPNVVVNRVKVAMTARGYEDFTLVLDENGIVEFSGGSLAMLPDMVPGGKLARPGSAVRLVDFPYADGGVLRPLLPMNPDGHPVRIDASSGKWKLDKPAVIKVSKNKADVFHYTISSKNGRDNLCAMKIAYSAKTGVFSGGFTVYEVILPSGKPKLVKYAFKFSGVVLGGVGYGKASCPKLGPDVCSLMID